MKIPMLAILSFPLFCQASYIRPIKDIITQRKYRVSEIRISAKTVQRCVEEDYPGNTPTCTRYEDRCEYLIQMPGASIFGDPEIYQIDLRQLDFGSFFGLGQIPISGSCQTTLSKWKEKYANQIITYFLREQVYDFTALNSGYAPFKCYRFITYTGSAQFAQGREWRVSMLFKPHTSVRPDAIYATQLDPKVCYQNSSR